MILSEFLNKSYLNIDQIYNIIKDKLPIFKDAIYSDPHNIILPVENGKYNSKKFAQLNKYLADTYNIFVSSGYRNVLYASSAEEAKHLTRIEQCNIAIANYFKEHPELEGQGTEFEMFGMYCFDIADRKFDNSMPYYHISEEPPSVILKTGLKAHNAVYRNSQYSYNDAVFLFSLGRATHYKNTQKSELTPVQIVGDNMDGYNYGSDTISYVYKVTLPKGVKASTDTAAIWWSSATFVEMNIKPENIECIGYYQPRNDKGLKTGYFTGDKTQVQSFTDIVVSDTPMKNVELKSSGEFTIESYTTKLNKYVDNVLLPRVNAIIKPVDSYGIHRHQLNNDVEETYKTLTDFIVAKLKDGALQKEIIMEIKELIIKRLEKWTFNVRDKEYLPKLKSMLADDKDKLKKLKALEIDEYSSDYIEHMYRIQDFTERVKDLNKRIREIQKKVKYYDEMKEQIYAL